MGQDNIWFSRPRKHSRHTWKSCFAALGSCFFTTYTALFYQKLREKMREIFYTTALFFVCTLLFSFSLPFLFFLLFSLFFLFFYFSFFSFFLSFLFLFSHYFLSSLHYFLVFTAQYSRDPGS